MPLSKNARCFNCPKCKEDFWLDENRKILDVEVAKQLYEHMENCLGPKQVKNKFPSTIEELLEELTKMNPKI